LTPALVEEAEAMGGRNAVMPSASGVADGAPLVVVVSLCIKPGHEEEFLGLLAPVLDAMRREASFINAVLHRDPQDSGRFMLYETLADRVDLAEVQMRRDYRRSYEARLPGLLREPRQVRIWHPLRGDFAFFGR
jgi:quinol monooxygenase YgiN